MDRSAISRVRSFNRLFTLRVGALNDSYLGRGRPLGLARLLFEVGPDGADLQDLRERLGLDSGYISRLLKTLTDDGLAVVEADLADRRRRRVELTKVGRAEWDAYDALSDDFARSMLQPLGERQRERLTAAMAEIELLLNAASITIALEPEDSEDAKRCVDAYFQELDRRFKNGFDPGNGGYAGDTKDRESRSWFLIARSDGQPVGCGALKALDATTGEIKRMWIAPDARGLGLSRRLLNELEGLAREAGMTRVRLDTNGTLKEAQALYRKAGYREIGRYNDNPYAELWFEKDLVTEGRETSAA
ncbi:bifunctional helix-turn-helix transcriptional regulator/GNAT family N-acetyltransferase [Neoaquamicrobium sediminum]|uniref:Helix-turn-helix domain-containing GNAT family N-acetyltransferase n=1 Tax=Neoaquamicrobium sediminum TaxID=1849104 RepID=A0ABV3WSK0_9HYPH